MTHRPLPWSETCFVCGESNPRGLDARFEVDEDGRVRLETSIDRNFEGYGAHVHGGVTTALLDETAGWAASVKLHRFCVTARITVTFRRPIPGESRILVVGEYLGPKGPFHRARAQITDGKGRVMAVADGLFSPVAEDHHRDVIHQLKMPGRPATPDDV
jgi:acyl-coenzyme A thioesterase PaaI-like protein